MLLSVSYCHLMHMLFSASVRLLLSASVHMFLSLCVLLSASVHMLLTLCMLLSAVVSVNKSSNSPVFCDVPHCMTAQRSRTAKTFHVFHFAVVSGALFSLFRVTVLPRSRSTCQTHPPQDTALLRNTNSCFHQQKAMLDRAL